MTKITLAMMGWMEMKMSLVVGVTRPVPRKISPILKLLMAWLAI